MSILYRQSNHPSNSCIERKSWHLYRIAKDLGRQMCINRWSTNIKRISNWNKRETGDELLEDKMNVYIKSTIQVIYMSNQIMIKTQQIMYDMYFQVWSTYYSANNPIPITNHT